MEFPCGRDRQEIKVGNTGDNGYVVMTLRAISQLIASALL